MLFLYYMYLPLQWKISLRTFKYQNRHIVVVAVRGIKAIQISVGHCNNDS